MMIAQRSLIQVAVSRNETYDVVVGFGLASNLLATVEQAVTTRDGVYALVDETVAQLHSDYFSSSMTNTSMRFETIRVPSGESFKDLATYHAVIDELVARGMQRRSILLLVGGGVIMDMGGLVGATFMRGVPIVNMPTTLVAQIDAAIGGEVAVNHKTGKNLIGAFYNPRLVVVDPYFLSTLADSQIRGGLAEIIKTAIIANPELFHLVEDCHEQIFRQDHTVLHRLASLTIQTKAALLEDDPLEFNLRRVLNFGHSLAHPLETVYQYQNISHGEAVAIGMSASVRYAVKHGVCTERTGTRIIDLLQAVGLPTEVSLQNHHQELVSAVRTVVRIRNGVLNFVVPRSIGKAAIIEQVDISEIVACLDGGD